MPAWTSEDLVAEPRDTTPRRLAGLDDARLGAPVELYGLVGPAERVALDALREELTDAERARADRYLDAHVADTFVLSRGWLRRLLGARLDLPARDVPLRFGAHGRPEVADTPLVFNVSHSGPVVLFAFARDVELGVDVERIRTDLAWAEIAERYFSERERADLAALPDDDRPLAFFRCWTRKEAYLKAKGAGLTFPLSRFDVTLDAEPRLLRTEIDGDRVDDWRLAEFAPHDGFVASVIVGPAP